MIAPQCGTVLAGLVGRGISRSRTPAMHMAEARAQGLAGEYRLLDTDMPGWRGMDLAAILSAAEAGGFDGLNVTYPFKVEIVALLDALSDNAAAVGAVNTVVLRGGRRVGHNTDLWGFAEGFRRGLPDACRAHVLLVGAGGAGAAVAHALADCGVARLSIHDSEGARAAALADRLRQTRPGLVAAAVDDIAALFAADRPDGLVNATPMGMAALPGMAVPADLLDPALWVADIVYVPLETALLRAARARGCRVLDGSGMAVFQAVRAFELFTGRPADPARMRATFETFDTDTPRPEPGH
ncbi:shikimate dehydrogenase [Rhodovulum strictum]|uniref:Shikimate dehydrogenase (NADP(+)) n=1 Tax=Rhodovulum strictum TaxID=58314 RepID=A0A844BA44_9RHOB|nr:shikimate dehydrogenase [Rhodovulum strictum]